MPFRNAQQTHKSVLQAKRKLMTMLLHNHPKP